jgi:hypothetical protein
VWNASQFECTASRLPNGSECRAPLNQYLIGDHECQSGLCELGGGGNYNCRGGAAVGEGCDDDPNDDAAVRCGPGLFCLYGSCAVQVGPGGSCGSEGFRVDNLCTNGACMSQWGDLMCSDAPVPLPAGGTAITCDGV